MKTSDIEITGFKPIGNHILTLPEQEEVVTKGGIILANHIDSHDKLKQHVAATVVAVSDKLKDQIPVGSKVHYRKMYELTFIINDVRHVILKDEHIDLVEEV
jgi:co-chaperonin GroES (HSP10)